MAGAGGAARRGIQSRVDFASSMPAADSIRSRAATVFDRARAAARGLCDHLRGLGFGSPAERSAGAWAAAQRLAGAVAMILVLAYGITLRSGDQASKELWADEAWRALLVDAARDVPSALRTLQVDGTVLQPGFALFPHDLLFARLGTFLFGRSEFALRFGPWLASIAALGGFAWAARQLLPRSLAALATFALAASDFSVRIAHEVNPHAGFQLSGVVCLVAVVGAGRGRWRWPWAVLACSVVALVFPVSFVFLSSVALLAWCRACCGDERAGRRDRLLFATSVAACGVFAAFVLLVLPAFGKVGWLQNYWAGNYLSDRGEIASVVAEKAPTWVALNLLPGLEAADIPAPMAWAVLLVAGVVTPVLAWRRRSVVYWLVAAPLLLQVVAAALGRFPVLSRMNVFYVPFVLVALLYPLAVAWQGASPRLRVRLDTLAAALVVTLVLAFALAMPREAHAGYRANQVGALPLLRHLEQVVQRDDVVLVDHAADFVIRFYAPDLPTRCRYHDVVTQQWRGDSGPKMLRRKIRANDGARVWIFRTPYHMDEPAIRAALGALGQSLDRATVTERGYLYAFRADASRLPAVEPPRPTPPDQRSP